MSADEQALLSRVFTLLINISRPDLLRGARREGYTTKEHKEGRRPLRLASGESKPIDHVFEESAAGASATAGAERLRLLQEIDSFENTWFPRTHAIIRRVVPRARTDAFEAAFFKDLEQQPLGPGVILSVGTFLSRLEGLAKREDADAKKVSETLVERGLTPEKLKDVRTLLGKLEGSLGGKKKGGKVPASDMAKAHEEQREALEDLRAWYNDWATTLRQVYGTRAQITLGLTELKRTAKDENDTPAEAPKGKAKTEEA